ncbi:MAG TPA: TM0106 family RecB-like putative nuclease [Candidatus Binatia bacterium]|nr:TM0106 family RecB-like putative nuclease [Candidatus Binatia bacterium]
MQRVDGRFIFAASDLNDYLECKRLAELDSLVARRKIRKPDEVDERKALIRRKGEEHERAYLEAMLARHPDGVERFGRSEPGIENYREAERETLEAMRRGKPIIYQATFFDGQFIGHADFLRRVDGAPSHLGDYSYEVIDTKLGLSARPYYLVQLCNYSEHLERLQGRMPEFGYVVFGDGAEQRFRLHDYMAYYRHLKTAFLHYADTLEARDEPREYPLKVRHCSVCDWNDSCTQQRVADDHLSLVAWMRRDQTAKFEAAGITSVAQLAETPDEKRPNGMTPETFVKLRRQASLQVRGRTSPQPIYELLEHAPPLGFALMPNPAPGDVFFDMEGDPLYEPGRGLEYLFGVWLPDEEPKYRAFWGTTRDEERRAFESFIDFIVDRRRKHPALHVYHYASYEKSALRRLAQEHTTREDQVDDLLRGEVLVDLFAVVRQALAISEDGYGLKKLERFYQLARETDVKKGDESIVMFERWMTEHDQRILDDIKAYNRDDCRSTLLLRDWLLERRKEAIVKFGADLPLRDAKRPDELCHPEFEPTCVKCVKRRDEEREEARRSDVERTLLAGVLAPRTEEEYGLMHADKRERYLLANLMAYHRREEKPAWWEYYDRCENVDELLEFDKTAIAGLKLREEVAPYKVSRSTVYTYSFPDQLHKMAAGDDADNPRTHKRAGIIVSIDDDDNLLALKTTAGLETARAIHELIPVGPPSSLPKRKALARLGKAYLEGTLRSEYPAAADLLANRDPVVRRRWHAEPSSRVTLSLSKADLATTLQPAEVNAATVSDVVQRLENSYLFIQGPPGSGKSTIGSQVICDLIERGKRVAVTSTSHKAIHNLLHKVEACIAARGKTFRGRYKYTNGDSEYKSDLAAPLIESVEKNEDLDRDDYQLAGGTSWLFARAELAHKFDYLFIDEAGQVSLADALAVAQCAHNVVLLGDPSQLAQVSQGRQPLHTGDSVLQHLLGEEQTVPPYRGIFLDFSYRMQPQICEFISDAMYDNRLAPAAETSDHRIMLGTTQLAGIYYEPIEHSGNGASSPEEANEIVRRIALLREKGMLLDSQPPESAGVPRPLTDRDVIVVTPYNAQRRLIQSKLRDAGLGVRVGTVDKFQGQEAAVVFYSMATSSGENVPRDVEFLFERNRFNVAISRARAASVLVCSPRLLDLPCRTPEQMALVNLLCAFAEVAQRRVALATA